MNKKRTNRLVAILNVIAIASMYILYFSASYLAGRVVPEDNIIYSFIQNTFINNITLIMVLLNSGVGIINIICGIQNKESKKICFWQIIFGLYVIWLAISLLDNNKVLEIGSKIVNIIPIILVAINFIKIKKNKPKVIQIISYVGVVIMAILALLNKVGAKWDIIAIVMQFIYIHFQDKNIKESNSRKRVNIILYYVIYAILVIGFLITILYLLLIGKINDVKWKNGLEDVYNQITTMQESAGKEELYIPVEKDQKFGFITEDGKEKIPCEYDKVTYFNEVDIKGSKYYIALAKKDDKFYIILKGNNVKELNGNLEKYTRALYNRRKLDEESFRLSFVQLFIMNIEDKTISSPLPQCLQNNEKKVTLTENNSKFTYKNEKYTMLIEPIREKIDEDDYYENYDKYIDDKIYYDDEDKAYYKDLYLGEMKCKVTVIKNNGDQKTETVYLPGLTEYGNGAEVGLKTFTNGFINFKSEDKTRVGWYDDNGNQVTISSDYEIRDIKENKIILIINNNDDDEEYDENEKEETNFVIIDMSGRKLLQTTYLETYDDMYLVKNNQKMVLLNNDLKQISNEYDKIISPWNEDWDK